MRKRNFTLVEMLTVIAIIGVLAGILIPTVTIAKRRAQEAQARTEVNSIVAAIKAYRQQYNKLPLNLTKKISDNKYTGQVTSTEYDDFMKMMCGQAISGANPRKTKFLTPRAKKSEDVDKVVHDPEVWLDPWGRMYYIFMDNDYNGTVSVKNEDLHGDIFTYSFGIDGTDNTKDDVNSWAK